MKSVYKNEIEIQFKHQDVVFFESNEIFTKEYIFDVLNPWRDYFEMALLDHDFLKVLYEKFKNSLIKKISKKVEFNNRSNDSICTINGNKISLHFTGHLKKLDTHEVGHTDPEAGDLCIDFEYKLVREDKFGNLFEFNFTTPCEKTYEYTPSEIFLCEIFKNDKFNIFDSYFSISINEKNFRLGLYDIFLNAVHELSIKDLKNKVSFQNPYITGVHDFIYLDGKVYSPSVLGFKDFEMSSEMLRKLSLLDLGYSLEQFMHDGLYPFSACGTIKFDAGNWIVNCRLEVEAIKEIFEKDVESRFGLIGGIVFNYKKY